MMKMMIMSIFLFIINRFLIINYNIEKKCEVSSNYKFIDM